MLRWRLAAAAAGLGVLLAAGGLYGAAGAADAPQAVSKVGQFEIGACGVIGAAVDDGLGVLVLVQQIDDTCSSQQAATFVMSAYSLQTLRRLAARTVDMQNVGYLAVGRLPLDTASHEVYLLAQSATRVYSLTDLLAGGAGELKSRRTLTLPIEATSMASGPDGSGVISPADPSGPAGDVSLLPSGAYFDQQRRVLDVVMTNDPYAGFFSSATSTRGEGAQDMYALVVDPSTGAQLGATSLPQCAYSMDTGGSANQTFKLASDPITVARRSDGAHLIVGCETARGYALPVNAQQGSALAYDVPLKDGLPDPARATAYQVGRPGYFGGIADPADGRLFMSSFPGFSAAGQSANASGPAAVVYDGLNAAFVGAPSMGGAREDTYGGVGIDAAAHRFYAVGIDGVTVVNGTSTPPGQGVLSTAYACAVGLTIADPASRRLFVQPFKGCRYSYGADALQPQIDVLHDGYSDLAQQGVADPDSYTKQVAEQAGVTEAQYSGHAEGTGARLMMLGGATGAIDGATFGTYIQLASNPEIGSPVNDYAPRSLQMANVPSTDLGNFQAQAATDAVTADDNTESTIESDTKQQNWAFPEVACSDSTGSEQTANQTYAAQTASSVACKLDDFASAATNAGATGFALTVAGQGTPTAAVEVSHSVVNTRVYLDPKQGMVAQVTSTAIGVDLGAIRIGNVTVLSTCRAHGRNGTAACTFQRTISGVTADGLPVDGGSCTQLQSFNGSSDGCGGLLAALNSVEPGYLTVLAPLPDSRRGFSGGSPGGYQAIAQRELYEHLQDAVVNYDDSIEVPGLELLYVQDSPTVPSRLDIQLANTEAEAHYGITMLPPACTACDASGPALAPAAPPAITVTHAPPPPPASTGGGLSRILQRVWQGLRLLLRSPAAAAAATALLLMLISPLLLGLRRRRLELLVQEVPA